MQINNNSLLTPEQVAGILQIHILTVYQYIRKGKLSAIKLGRSYRIMPEDLERLIEMNRVTNQIQCKASEGKKYGK
jgi:excisionase family DNA binding protein